jgi:anaerobic ribonucleoside-triphosphate reductase activating protein
MRSTSSNAGDYSMLLHAVIECSLVNGPGRRTVIWVQGCELQCAGCWNQDSHRYSGTPVPVDHVAARVLDAACVHEVEGLTLSGGEPMHQIEEVVGLLSFLRESDPHLSAGLFSGYTEKELREGRFHTYKPLNQGERCALWKRVRGLLDFGVLGRFNRHQMSSDPLVSSRNQQLRRFSSRYTQADFQSQAVEVTIDPDGFTQITGFPTLGAFR